jgi:hypothetical protein
MHEVEFQGFVDLLHQAAEEDGILDLDDPSLDNVVPLDVIQQFAGSFASSLDEWMRSLATEEACSVVSGHGGTPAVAFVASDR